MKLIFFLAAVICLIQIGHSMDTYSCGEKKTFIRKYGKVEMRVDCELIKGRILVSEFKGNILHGSSQGFDRGSGWRRDSCFYMNGKETGLSLVWDSLGNVIRRSTTKNGVQVGKMESFFGLGRPAVVKFYNSSGREDGPIQEWWKNGNKKAELVAKNGQIVSGTEYYPDGKPRIAYVTKYQPKRGVFGTKYIQLESWAPDGRPSGKIVAGNGEYLIWPAEPSSPFFLHREIYKDSLMIQVDELDSAKVELWLKNQPPSPPKKEAEKSSNSTNPSAPKP